MLTYKEKQHLESQARRRTPIEMTEVEFIIESDQSIGVCIACGYKQEETNDNAEFVECEDCGRRLVFGLNEAANRGKITFVKRGMP